LEKTVFAPDPLLPVLNAIEKLYDEWQNDTTKPDNPNRLSGLCWTLETTAEKQGYFRTRNRVDSIISTDLIDNLPPFHYNMD
jgi:hypothetical protein